MIPSKSILSRAHFHIWLSCLSVFTSASYVTAAAPPTMDDELIVMEFCNRGDLQNLIRKAKEKNVAGLKENVIWNIAIQVNNNTSLYLSTSYMISAVSLLLLHDLVLNIPPYQYNCDVFMNQLYPHQSAKPLSAHSLGFLGYSP